MVAATRDQAALTPREANYGKYWCTMYERRERRASQSEESPAQLARQRSFCEYCQKLTGGWTQACVYLLSPPLPHRPPLELHPRQDGNPCHPPMYVVSGSARQISTSSEPLQLARSRLAANANLRHAALGMGEDRPSSASFALHRRALILYHTSSPVQ